MILMRAEAVIKGCRMYTGYIIISAEIKETIGHSEFSQAPLPFRYKLISTLTPNQASPKASKHACARSLTLFSHQIKLSRPRGVDPLGVVSIQG